MTAMRALKRQGPAYFSPSSYALTHRMRDANDLLRVEQDYGWRKGDEQPAKKP